MSDVHLNSNISQKLVSALSIDDFIGMNLSAFLYQIFEGEVLNKLFSTQSRNRILLWDSRRSSIGCSGRKIAVTKTEFVATAGKCYIRCYSSFISFGFDIVFTSGSAKIISLDWIQRDLCIW